MTRTYIELFWHVYGGYTVGNGVFLSPHYNHNIRAGTIQTMFVYPHSIHCTAPRLSQNKLKMSLGYCFTPYQRPRLYNGATFSRLLRHAGDTEDVLSA